MAQPLDLELEEEFAQKRMTRALFTRLFSYVRPYRRLVILNLIFTVLATASQLLGPKFIQVGIDRYLTQVTSVDAAIHGQCRRVIHSRHGTPQGDASRVLLQVKVKCVLVCDGEIIRRHAPRRLCSVFRRRIRMMLQAPISSPTIPTPSDFNNIAIHTLKLTNCEGMTRFSLWFGTPKINERSPRYGR